jgi:uncharacterized damage-inducible protein DinB
VDFERTDLLKTLDQHRAFLRRTVQGLTDEQASLRPTASELCLGGIIKHVSLVEDGWVKFIVEGPSAIEGFDESAQESHAAGFRMLEADTMEALLHRYEEIATRTSDVVSNVPSLDDTQPLPTAPWFEPGARWTARRVLLHVLAETSQHAGHADIIRESIDGSKTMG